MPTIARRTCNIRQVFLLLLNFFQNSIIIIRKAGGQVWLINGGCAWQAKSFEWVTRRATAARCWKDRKPIEESTKLVVITKTIVKKKKGKVISSETVEVARYDHIYVSTAAYGGTIFWKHNPAYMEATGAKEYK